MSAPDSTTARAVFLSYASQDAEAAKKICAVLRAAGIEVWFDQNELVGGDSWDQKIRRQIKECALFVPIVSAATQARREGYFRLEWKLADDRTQLMAKGTPFLVPVCIDETKDWDALVPDSFMTVQWTRLPGGETPPKFADRVAQLLGGSGLESGRPRPAQRDPKRDEGVASPVKPAQSRSWLVPAIAGAAILVAVTAFFALRSKSSAPTAAEPASIAQDDAELRRAQQLLDSPEAIATDVTLAEELCRGVLAKKPADPAASIMMARVQTYLLLRGFDRSDARYSQAKQAAERALALAPDDPEAAGAMGTYLYARGVELPRAAKLFRQAIAARPNEPRFYRMLDNVLSNDRSVPFADVIASAEKTAQRFPKDPLVHYELARHYRDLALLEPTERELDLAIKLGPVANAIIAKARLALTVRGDTAAMKVLIEQLPERYRTTDRAVFTNFVYAIASGDYDNGLEALRSTPEPWMVDFEFTGPRALLEGELLLLKGKTELARLSFESAQQEFTKHAAVANISFRSMWLEAWLLSRLGRSEEARTRNAVIFPEYQRPFRIFLGQGWWFAPIALNLIIGERAKALDLMREAVDFQDGRGILRVAMRIDPRMAPFRDDPEIKAILAEPGAGQGPKIAVSTRVWPRNSELKRAVALLDGLDSVRDDFLLAEEIVKHELDRSPADPETVTVMARVQSQYLLRNFDRRAARVALARQYGERALQLAPDEPEAMYALAIFLGSRGADAARAESLLRRACEMDPGQPRYWRLLSIQTFDRDRDEGIKLAEENVRRFPADALVHYELSILYRNQRRGADFERETDATIALAPVANAMVWKARAMFGLHGDLAGMKTWLDRVPARLASQERTVYSRFLYAAMSGDYETGLTALRGFTEPWFMDSTEYGGPTALLRATLLELQGKGALARMEYEAALAEALRQKAAVPTDLYARSSEIWALRGLGRLEEARTLNRLLLETVARPMRLSPFFWWFGAIPGSLLIGERDTALMLLREAVATPTGKEAARVHFRTDPRMAPFRDDPEIKALISEPKDDKPAAAVAATTGSGPAAQGEGAQLAARAKTLYTKLAYTRDDLATAEELARRATDKEPDSAAAWGARAAVSATYLQRLWDVSEKRLQETQSAANRALALNPDEPEALWALGRMLVRQGATAQAEVSLRRVVALVPTDNRFVRSHAGVLAILGRVEEQRAILLAAVRRDPRDPLLRYDLAQTFANYSSGTDQEKLRQALEHLDVGIAAQPLGSLLLLKAVLLAGWRGDLRGMRAVLDELEKLPLAERAEDRAVFIAMWGALLEHDPDRCAAAATLTAKNYFDDTVLPRRPKDWMLALAHHQAGKENLARLDWQRAEVVVRARLREDPNSQGLICELATTLAWLGRSDEAAKEFGPVEAAWREELTGARARGVAQYYGALGEAAKAVPYLHRCLETSVYLTRRTLPLDPWWDKLRGQPEFEALLKEPEAKK